MSTQINHYNGNVLVVIQDGNLDVNSSSLKLPGKDFENYGSLILDDLVWVMENFAAVFSPGNPNVGQLWYDTSTKQLRISDNTIYKGSTFNTLPLSSPINKNPINPSINPWNTFDSIGITDTNGIVHQAWRIGLSNTVTNTGQAVALFSADPVYTPNVFLTSSTIPGISTVNPGLILINSNVNVGITSQTGNFSTIEFNNTNYNKPSGSIDFDGYQFGVTLPNLNGNARYTPVYRENLINQHRVYVSTTGSDVLINGLPNDGSSPDRPFRSIRAALATSNVMVGGCSIYIESGLYHEANPLYVPPKTSIIGDNLRRVVIVPYHPTLDIWHADNATYFYGLTMRGHKNPSFCFAFPCSLATPVLSNGTSGNVTAINYAYSYSNYPTGNVQINVETARSPTSTLVTANAFAVNGAITEITITNPGKGYDNGANVIISGNGLSAQANARVAYLPGVGNVVVAIDIINPGMSYTYANVIITGSNISTATATIPIANQTITNYSYGFPSTPILSPYNGINNGVINSFTVLNPNNNGPYSINPVISIPLPTQSNVIITSSPYVQNCSSLTGPWDTNGLQIPFPGSKAIPIQNDGGAVGPPLPWYSNVQPTSTSAFQNINGAGGGIRIDGAVLSNVTVLSSFVADSFTQINQGGIGHLTINAGYAQFVSCFTTFCSVGYWARSGGQASITNSVIDFGNVGIQSDGLYPNPYITNGVVVNQISSSVQNIGLTSSGSGYVGPGAATTFVFPIAWSYNGGASINATGNVYVQNGSVFFIQLVTNGSGYYSNPIINLTNGQSGGGFVAATAVVTMVQNTSLQITNLNTQPKFGSVLTFGDGNYYTVTGANLLISSSNTYTITTNPVVVGVSSTQQTKFNIVSNISTGSLTCEYVGSGVNFNALPIYNGIPNPLLEVQTTYPGQIYYSIIDNIGNFKVGPICWSGILSSLSAMPQGWIRPLEGGPNSTPPWRIRVGRRGCSRLTGPLKAKLLALSAISAWPFIRGLSCVWLSAGAEAPPT